MSGETSDVIRKMLSAYLARDRDRVDALLHEGLEFTSPYDAKLSKAQYFERCWQGGDAFVAMRIDRLFVGGAQGDEGFVRYEIQTKDGRRIHNVELIRVDEGRIREVHVYFGEPTHGEPAHGQPTHGEPIHGEPIHGEQTHGQQTHGQQTHGEPTHEVPK